MMIEIFNGMISEKHETPSIKALLEERDQLRREVKLKIDTKLYNRYKS